MARHIEEAEGQQEKWVFGHARREPGPVPLRRGPQPLGEHEADADQQRIYERRARPFRL